MNNIVVLANEVNKEFSTQPLSGPCAERAEAIASKQAKNTPVMNYLRDLIWNGSYGVNKIWLNTKNSCNYNLSRGWLKTIPAWRFEDHFAGKDLLYACGNPWDTRYALGMIDIDALGHLSAKKARDAGLPPPPTPPRAAEKAEEAARAVDALFMEYGLTRVGAIIFWERSSNGVGMSGYILFGGPQKREAYQLLQAFLKHKLQPLVDGGKIEGIEVKGKPPEMEDVIIQGHVVHQRCVTLGTLCKLPSTATLEDLKKLPKLRLDDLKSLPGARGQAATAEGSSPTTKHSP